MPQETWVPVIGYEGYYEVSDFGRVRSVGRVSGGVFYPSVLKRPFSKRGGSKPYKMLFLAREGVGKNISLHRIVYCSFNNVPLRSSPSARLVVCHLNDIVDDNRLVNLKLQDRKKNMEDYMRNKKKECVPRPTGETGVGKSLLSLALYLLRIE